MKNRLENSSQAPATDREVLTPVAALRHWLGEDIDVSVQTAFITWGERCFRVIEQALQAEPWPRWPYHNRNRLSVTDDGLAVLWAPIGAPGTVMMSEELRALGAQTFIGFGLAGGISTGLRPGDLVLPNRCVAEDGTSAHYGGSDNLRPSDILLRALGQSCSARGLSVTEGTVWTTDAPYRETVRKITHFRNQNVLAVDMETSGMYAFARFRGVDVCNILVVADLVGSDWDPAGLFAQEDLQALLENAGCAAVSAVRGLERRTPR